MDIVPEKTRTVEQALTLAKAANPPHILIGWWNTFEASELESPMGRRRAAAHPAVGASGQLVVAAPPHN